MLILWDDASDIILLDYPQDISVWMKEELLVFLAHTTIGYKTACNLHHQVLYVYPEQSKRIIHNMPTPQSGLLHLWTVPVILRPS